MAVLSRKLQQLDEDREKCSDKIRNTEVRLEQVSQAGDESERFGKQDLAGSEQAHDVIFSLLF